jgi:hypothetical protein
VRGHGDARRLIDEFGTESFDRCALIGPGHFQTTIGYCLSHQPGIAHSLAIRLSPIRSRRARRDLGHRIH